MNAASAIEDLAFNAFKWDFFVTLIFGAALLLIMWFLDAPNGWLVPVLLVWATAVLAGCIANAAQAVGGQVKISVDYAVNQLHATVEQLQESVELLMAHDQATEPD